MRPATPQDDDNESPIPIGPPSGTRVLFKNLNIRLRMLVWLSGATIGAIVSANLLVISLGAYFSSGEHWPVFEAGILLGTDPIGKDGSTNDHFLRRVSKSVDAIDKYSINTLIVSGHTNNRGYNEVLGMQRELISRGVEPTKIILDSGGFRTFESARRAHQIFKLTNAVVVTDSFHSYRTALVFRYFGVSTKIETTHGADTGLKWWKHQFREALARCKALFDIAIDFVVNRMFS